MPEFWEPCLLCCPTPRRKVAKMGSPPRLRFGVFPREYNEDLIIMFITYVTIAYCFLRLCIISIAHTQQASAFRHKLQKYFSIVHSDCITACPFSTKKGAKMSVFYVKYVKICRHLGATPLDPLGLWQLGVLPPDPWLCPSPPLQNTGCTTDTAYYYGMLFLCLTLEGMEMKDAN